MLQAPSSRDPRVAEGFSKGVVMGLSLGSEGDIALRVQVPNNHILTQNLYYNC